MTQKAKRRVKIYFNLQPVTKTREGSCYNNNKRKSISYQIEAFKNLGRKIVIRKKHTKLADLHNYTNTVKNDFNHMA